MKFNMNSPLMDFLNTSAHYAALNLIFLMTCIPVITIGPALAALYQVMLREARGEHGYLIRKYFQHFKEMFWQAMFTFIFFTALLLLITFSFVFWFHTEGTLAAVVSVLLFILGTVVCSGMIYVFPLMARFKNGFILTIKNALVLSLANTKITFILLILHLSEIGIIVLFPPIRVLMLIVGFTAFVYGFSFIFTRLFKSYEPNELPSPAFSHDM